jgi:uncharacterized protein
MASPFIETRTGVRFQPLSPVVDDICIEDIAHALSNQCRFSGHVRTFYSVAEHCVRVAELLRYWGAPTEIQLWGLLHDASEAYLVDLPTPLKSHPSIGDGYRAAEEALMHAVCARFGLPETMPDLVRRADAKMLATEVRDLMFARPEHWAALKEAPIGDGYRIAPWAPATAAYEFTLRFEALTQGK